jgi:class 3 adenylate cyclase
VKAQRKKLTIYFSDIKDFTATTENMSSEDLTYLLNKYFTEMSTIALSHGATIDKFVGDAMLMFFGDPETRGVKEDALACVRMAIAMQRRMRDLQSMWREKGYENPFQVRIGINTGFCNVGNFGSDARMDYTVIGAEVNLAARPEWRTRQHPSVLRNRAGARSISGGRARAGWARDRARFRHCAARNLTRPRATRATSAANARD